MIARIERRTLREQVLDQLKEEILSGALPPGTHLSEVSLAESFSVSRGTVREALRSLQQAQLVEDAPRGLQVRSMSPREIIDLYATRGALEGLAITTVMNQEDAKQVVDALYRALPKPDPHSADFVEVLEADLNFHKTLVESSKNQVLIHLWHRLQDQMKVAILSDAHNQVRNLMSRNHHLSILEAMESGDKEEANKLLVAHMNTAAQMLAGTDE